MFEKLITVSIADTVAAKIIANRLEGSFDSLPWKEVSCLLEALRDLLMSTFVTDHVSLTSYLEILESSVRVGTSMKFEFTSEASISEVISVFLTQILQGNSASSKPIFVNFGSKIQNLIDLSTREFLFTNGGRKIPVPLQLTVEDQTFLIRGSYLPKPRPEFMDIPCEDFIGVVDALERSERQVRFQGEAGKRVAFYVPLAHFDTLHQLLKSQDQVEVRLASRQDNKGRTDFYVEKILELEIS